MAGNEFVTVRVALIGRETGQAFLFVLDPEDRGRDLWAPKSVVEDPDGFSEGDQDVEVSIKKWFARKNDLDD